MSTSYFAGFAGFEPDPRATIEAEWCRLARFKGWRAGTKKWRAQRERCFASEFAALFALHCYKDGAAARLGKWQALCAEVRIAPVPASITQCKIALRKVHVNLVDLIDSRRAGERGRVRRFASKQALQEYTATTPGKVFPKQAAKDDGFLKALLREIF